MRMAELWKWIGVTSRAAAGAVTSRALCLVTQPPVAPLLCELLTLMVPLAQKKLLRELPGIDVAQEPEGEGEGREGEGESGKGERMNRGPEEKM